MSAGPTDPDISRLAAAVGLAVFDFDGVFTDNTVTVAQDGTESVTCWRGDGLGLEALREAGVDSLVLSTEANPVVSARCAKLRVACVQGLADKAAALSEAARERGIDLERVAYLGNDINDTGCLEIAGLPAVTADAHPAVLGLARYVTAAPGGRGAVREMCDLVVEAKRTGGGVS